MFKFNSSIYKIFLLSFFSISVYAQLHDPLDNGTPVCGVHICNIELTVEALSKIDENKRYNYINNLVTTYIDSKNITILENLLLSANKIKKLLIDLGDAKWVIRESSTLANNSILNLTKYSPIDKNNLFNLFKQLDNATKRFDIINHFSVEVDTIEDIDVLEDLVAFAEMAQKYTVSIGDESWISRAAASLASKITIKLVALDPMHEGVYSIEVTNYNKNNNILKFDKVVILDSSSEKNLIVNFINSKYKKVIFSYSHAIISGNSISGKILSNDGLSSKFDLLLNRKTKTISGKILTTRTREIQFKGTQEFSISSIFKGEVPYPVNDESIIGTMQGSILGIKGALSIQSFLPYQYSASFVAQDGLVVIDFQGKFFPGKGVLTFTHKNKIKLVLSFRETGKNIQWNGVTYTINHGIISKAHFLPMN